MHVAAHSKGPACKMGRAGMTVFLAIEASQPNGTVYRVALGITVPVVLISTVAAFMRLF